MRRVIPLALLMGALLVQSVFAAPTQMDASAEPAVEGPATLKDTRCDRKERRNDGQLVAVIKRCLKFYEYDAAAESDAERDYGVVWLQSNVDGKNGWCTKRVASDILLPADLGLHSFQPKGVTEITKVQRLETRLSADAGGTSSTPARISQQWLGYPTQVRGVLRDDGGIFRVKWAGTSAAKLGFAGGIEISWTPESPPDGLSYQLNFALGSPDTC